jgi:hypothetical protein
MQPTEIRAEKPRIPAATKSQQRAGQERRQYLRGREALETRSILRGLVLVALTVLLVSMARAGWSRVFGPGWWRP